MLTTSQRITNYIDEKRQFSAFMLYLFLIGFYGFEIGFPLSTYVVFGLAYFYFLNKILETLMLESETLKLKFMKIDKYFFLIIFISLLMLFFVAEHWELVVFFSLASLFFLFIKNIAVLFISKF